jgi:hypothetical protein
MGHEHAHFLVIIARINGKKDTKSFFSFTIRIYLGGMLNFNCSLVLLLMLRKHITWLRTKGGNIMLPLDCHIDIHKIIGVIILIESLLHTTAHLAYLG